MSEVPADLRYTKEHEWARRDDDRVVVGITDYAQDQLGDVVFVGLPEVGADVEAGKPLGEVESTKSVSDVYSPISGRIAATNPEVEQNPELVNEEPYGRGWLVAIEGGDIDGLMSADEYKALIEGAASA
ncbi:MAG TPA: glycine cleavage system protein GcvH [Actinomycetota bacterium]|nr:glycine cleavage system protein GcvH [Actinomycetota bacterium]